MHMNIISPIFKGRMHMASCFSISPLDPNLWKVHLVIRGKMYTWLQRFDMKVEWILNYSKPATIVQMHKSISSESLLENLLQNLQLCYIREKYSASYKTSTPPPPHPSLDFQWNMASMEFWQTQSSWCQNRGRADSIKFPAHHWIDPIFLISLRKWYDFNPKSEECAVEKAIHQEHLTCKWECSWSPDEYKSKYTNLKTQSLGWNADWSCMFRTHRPHWG